MPVTPRSITIARIPLARSGIIFHDPLAPTHLRIDAYALKTRERTTQYIITVYPATLRGEFETMNLCLGADNSVPLHEAPRLTRLGIESSARYAARMLAEIAQSDGAPSAFDAGTIHDNLMKACERALAHAIRSNLDRPRIAYELTEFCEGYREIAAAV